MGNCSDCISGDLSEPVPDFSSLSLMDDQKPPSAFDLKNIETRYCAEDEYTRLAKDLIIYTVDYKFLVKTWSNPTYRAKSSHGNAFGMFWYRPPKKLPGPSDIENTVPMWEEQFRGWLLTWKIEKGLGDKDEELAGIFGEEMAEVLLQKAFTSKVRCYVIPSKFQTDKSSIAAPMVTLVNFEQVEEIDLDKSSEYSWLPLEQALDPECNLHAGVIARFCLEKEIVNFEFLKKFGWTKENMYLQVKLDKQVNTVEKWGSHHGRIMHKMKKILRKEQSLDPPQEARTFKTQKALTFDANAPKL